MRARQILFVILCCVGCATAATPANAKLSADVTVEADGAAQRIVATVRTDRRMSPRQRPTRLELRVKGKVVQLARRKATLPAGVVGSYRSPKLSGERGRAAQSLVGTRVRLTAIAPAGRTTLRSTVQPPTPQPGGNAPPSPTAPTPPPPTPAPITPGAAPLFTPPATALVGDAAYQAVRDYFANATLTTCVAGWPNCSVEERYSIATDGTFRYCRLTPNAGSDVNSVGSVTGIVGAEQALDGSWGVTFQENSYGTVHQYTFRVAADGSAGVLYWDGTTSFAEPQNASYTGFTWQRGAKTCAY